MSSSSQPMSLFILPEDQQSLPDFVNEVDEKYLCIKCQHVLYPPVRQLLCGHRMCRNCITTLRQTAGDTKCPGEDDDCAETNITNEEHVFPDFGTEKELKKLPVYCGNRKYGCIESIPWSTLKKHMDECEFKPMECRYRQYGCPELLAKKAMDEHNKVCQYQTEKCEHCNKMVPKAEMHDGHREQCMMQPRKCQFQSMGCKFEGMLNEVNDHVATAHQEHITIILTQFQQLKFNEEKISRDLKETQQENKGLKIELNKARKDHEDMKKHYDKMIKGLQKVTGANAEKLVELKQLEEPAKLISPLQTTTQMHEQRIQQLENRQSSGSHGMSDDVRNRVRAIEQSISMHDIRLAEYDLRFQCLETASYDGTLVWKIRDYARRKRDAVTGPTSSLYSQPFYTSKFGYKMCARVYLNGDGMGKGSHMSLFFVIMKGDYDSLLSWPFRQKVTLSLLDQESGRHNMSDTFRPDPTSTSFKKPTAEMNVASGCPLFVAQSVLESNMYLKDDTIFIKISVDTSDLGYP